MESDDAAFDELIEKSSLGTPGARQLRARTSQSHADTVLQIIKLRNVMAHGSRDEIVSAANTLLQLFGDLGYDEQVQRVLAEAFPGQEAETVLTMARFIADSRQASQQKAQPASDRRRRSENDSAARGSVPQNDGRGPATGVTETVSTALPAEQERKIEDPVAELTQIQEQQGHDALARAADSLVDQAPGVAVELLTRAVADCPAGTARYGWLSSRLADAHYRMGDAAAAEQVASLALEYATEPDVVEDLHWTLAQCRMLAGPVAESLAALDRALAASRISARHRARLLVLATRTHLHLGEVEEAGRVAARALEAATEADDNWAMAWALRVLTIVTGCRGTRPTRCRCSSGRWP